MIDNNSIELSNKLHNIVNECYVDIKDKIGNVFYLTIFRRVHMPVNRVIESHRNIIFMELNTRLTDKPLNNAFNQRI